MLAKSVLDRFGALFALTLLMPIILIIAALVRVTSSGPALYWSSRVGRHNQPFMMPRISNNACWLSRSCHPFALQSKGLADAVRPFLRKSSLDELPQLLSILKGDMSFGTSSRFVQSG